MRYYLLRKIALLFPMLIGITLMTFTLAKSLPGDPVYSMVGERADPKTMEKIRREIGADRDIVSQYIGYVSLLIKGEMGRSYFTNRRVSEDIAAKFPNTLILASTAMVIAIPLGILLGFISALKSNSVTDRIISGLSISGLSVPVFWSGLLLMLFFSLKLKILPPSGTGDLRHLLLPALTLSIPAASTLVRVTRVTVLDILHMPFVITARAKGINENKINFVHVLKNALIPVVTITGLEFGNYLNGAVLTETIFGWDGLGRFAMEGIIKRDFPVIMGCIITGTLAFVLLNLFVDILYFYIDPRLRTHGTNS